MSQGTELENIEQFCSYFERQLDVISRLDVDLRALPGAAVEDYQVRFYRKALIVIGIDTLAGVRFPKVSFPDLNRRNRERFVRFLREVAQWTDGERVSVPFLLDRLKKAGIDKGILGKHLEHEMSKFDVTAGGQIGITKMDVPAQELLTRTTSEKEELFISELQHYSILYRYRNRLVHESREPGSSMEIDSLKSEPYYHGYIHDTRWYLVYPMQVFADLFRSSVQGLRDYLIANGINPYDYDVIDETSRW